MKRKVFLSGLNFSTDEEVLENYFSQYGAISDILINKDRYTGKRKGFGFVLFQDESVSSYILNYIPEHMIDGRIVTCKPCIEKGKAYKQNECSFQSLPYSECQQTYMNTQAPEWMHSFVIPATFKPAQIAPLLRVPSGCPSPQAFFNSNPDSKVSDSLKRLSSVLLLSDSVAANHVGSNILISQV